MNIKEKMLFIVVASLVGLAIGYTIINSIFIAPARDAQSYVDKYKIELESLETRINRRIPNLKKLNNVLEKTYVGDFDTDDVETLRLSRIRLRQMALVAGLQEDLLELKAMPGRSTPGAGGFIQTGWKVSVQGRLDNLIKFLHNLSDDKYIQKIDSLIITPNLAEAEFHVAFKYSTLVLTGKPKKKASSKDKPDQDLTADLAEISEPGDKISKAMEAIIARDIFRPYIQAEPIVVAPPKPDPPKPPRPPRRPDPPKNDVHLRIVGLPSFSDNPAKSSVLVRDDRNDIVKEYRCGNDLDGSEIVLVDYRVLPSNTQPEFNSYSRVIIKRDDGYYSVDLGDKLSDAARMPDEQLPESLQAKLKAEQQPEPLPDTADELELGPRHVSMAQNADQDQVLPQLEMPELPEVISAHEMMAQAHREGNIFTTQPESPYGNNYEDDGMGQ